MKVTNIVDEDFVNYRNPGMFIGTIRCNGKCCIEQKVPLTICQNNEWRNSKIIDINDDEIIKRYLKNPLTKCIIFGGLEPFEQFEELSFFIYKLRIQYNCNDDIVIYTGYDRSEIEYEIDILSHYKNIIVKFGRYLLNREKRYDDILGITLASDNQYAERLYLSIT